MMASALPPAAFRVKVAIEAEVPKGRRSLAPDVRIRAAQGKVERVPQGRHLCERGRSKKTTEAKYGKSQFSNHD